MRRHSGLIRMKLSVIFNTIQDQEMDIFGQKIQSARTNILSAPISSYQLLSARISSYQLVSARKMSYQLLSARIILSKYLAFVSLQLMISSHVMLCPRHHEIISQLLSAG